MLTAELTTVYLDTADLTQADIEQGEALLEAVHCPKHHGGRGHAEIMMMCKELYRLCFSFHLSQSSSLTMPATIVS